MYRNKFRRDGGGYQIQKATSTVRRGKEVRKVEVYCVGVIIISAALYAPKNPPLPSLSFFVSALLMIGAAVP
jgi:hypothetical protein